MRKKNFLQILLLSIFGIASCTSLKEEVTQSSTPTYIFTNIR